MKGEFTYTGLEVLYIISRPLLIGHFFKFSKADLYLSRDLQEISSLLTSSAVLKICPGKKGHVPEIFAAALYVLYVCL